MGDGIKGIIGKIFGGKATETEPLTTTIGNFDYEVGKLSEAVHGVDYSLDDLETFIQQGQASLLEMSDEKQAELFLEDLEFAEKQLDIGRGAQNDFTDFREGLDQS